MKRKSKSTYEKFIEDTGQKKILNKEYTELLISELISAAMEGDHVSVRKLAAKVGISPTIIQGLRSGVKTNFTISTLSRILDAIGYRIMYVPKDRYEKKVNIA